MSWVIGAIWTKQRQAELAKHFAGTLHSMRLSSDPDYATHNQVILVVQVIPTAGLLSSIGDRLVIIVEKLP